MIDLFGNKYIKRLVVTIGVIALIVILLGTAGPYVFVINAIPGQIPLSDEDRNELLNSTVERVEQVSEQVKENVLKLYGKQDINRYNLDDRSGVVPLARIILANFRLNENVDECNTLLQKLVVWGRSGSSWQLHTTGDYDFALIWMTTILYEFGDREEILYPEAREYLLDVLMTDEGKLDLKVPRTGRMLFDTENHLLMREGSRYLKNQWLKKHGNNSAKYDNDKNGLGDWLEKYLNHTRLHGTYEYNSVPYIVYSVLPLMNIADYAESKTIRKLAEAVLDNFAIRFAYGSFNLRQCAPFRRRYEHAEDQSLYLNRYSGVIRFWLDNNSYGREHMILGAVIHDYTLPVTAYELLSQRQDVDYYKIYGHDQKGSPEIYSGGKNYLLSAGGAYRGEYAKVISRPIALLVDDDAKELSDCIHIKGKGDWKEWNMSGVHRRFAVARGSVFVPERYGYQTKPGWNVVKVNDSVTVGFYQGDDLAILIVLPDVQVSEDQVIEMLRESNPSLEESKQFNWPEVIAPENIETIDFDINATSDKWVITAINQKLPEGIPTTAFEDWAFMQ